MSDNKFGNQIKLCELAIKLGYHRDTIAKWETGSSISKYALEDICTFFGIEI